MMISDATARALDRLSLRERETLDAFEPVAGPEDAGNPLAASAPAGAYFVTADARGRHLYTHAGSFTVRDGVLADAQGRDVLGYVTAGDALQILRIDPVDAALGFTNSLQLTADGKLAYERAEIDPATGRRELSPTTVGTLALARFPAGTKMQQVDAHHAIPANGALPHTGRPEDGNFAALGALSYDERTADLDRTLERLQEAYAAFDALRAAGKASGSADKTAMDLLK